jgi:hypothetical protein
MSNNVFRTISKKQTPEVKRYINESAEWTLGKHFKGWKLCQFQPNQYKQNKNQSPITLSVSLTNYQTITFNIGGSDLLPYSFHQLGSKWVHNNLPKLTAENPTKIHVLIFCQILEGALRPCIGSDTGWREATRLYLVKIIDKLSQVLNRVDVMMRWGRNEGDSWLWVA